ncbi:hypothetical protein Q9S36_40065 [Microbacterium sp. ARD31]|uniref:hypothetical protein n=1 Tax=Microbacterium sp. ARD31 TaxID=2962576 RepID=UPI002882BF36|nr:hypothetical protein [Microbacterium sp. ARD31]MDT0186400.1 hypothetical protein [Microbacterium sp. ARD31]
MDQVEPVRDERTRGGGMGLACHGQLGDRVLANFGRAVAARGEHRVTLVTRMALHDSPLDRQPELRDLRQPPRAESVGGAGQDLARRRLVSRWWRLEERVGDWHA